MNPKSKEIVDKVALRLLQVYASEIEATKDELEYCATYTGALVFANLAKSKFLSTLEMDFDESSGETPSSICEKMEDLAKTASEDIQQQTKNSYN